MDIKQIATQGALNRMATTIRQSQDYAIRGTMPATESAKLAAEAKRRELQTNRYF